MVRVGVGRARRSQATLTYFKEVAVVGSNGYRRPDLDTALAMLAGGGIAWREWLTHTLPPRRLAPRASASPPGPSATGRSRSRSPPERPGEGRRLSPFLAGSWETGMQEWAGVAGKRVIITGATGGIGLAAARELARRGARLSIVARSESRAAAAIDRIVAAGGTGTEVEVLSADLGSQASIRSWPRRSWPGTRRSTC